MPHQWNTSRIFFQLNTDAGVSLWELLVNETNKYQELYKRKNPVLKPASKVHQWQDVTVPQMKAFIGCVLNMGINRKHTIEEYWNTTDWSQDFPMFRHVFKLDTFKLILRFFHVSDSELEPPRGSPNYDQLYKLGLYWTTSTQPGLGNSTLVVKFLLMKQLWASKVDTV